MQGDLFEVPVNAIVNSEQTDFILARNLGTISGQIRARFGDGIQDELDRQTQGLILPPGTVLKSIGPEETPVIYHAGFHEPDQWLPEDTEDYQTEYVRSIGRCIQWILADMEDDGPSSTAFPLLGCGVFGLDPALLAQQFIQEALGFAERLRAKKAQEKELWLVVADESLANRVLNSCVQAIIDNETAALDYSSLNLDIDFLNSFLQKIEGCNHRLWSSWLLVNYSGLITHFILSSLATCHRPAIGPADIVDKGRPLPFGAIRSKAVELAKALGERPPPSGWPAFLRDLILSDVKEGKRLEHLNQDRNNIAHGRAFRDPATIRNDLIAFVRVAEWQALLSTEGPPDLEALDPWISRPPRDEQSERPVHGVFERWQSGNYYYLIPHTGLVYERPVVFVGH